MTRVGNTLQYTAPAGYTGANSFTYTICNNAPTVVCATATVTIVAAAAATAAIPTLSEWGLLLTSGLVALLALCSGWCAPRRTND